MNVRTTRLESGLTIATDTIPTVESVTLGAWIHVGTRHEPDHQNGVAHLLEHMVFKGTRRRNARQIAEEIEAVGGHLNAYTGREHTAFYARVLAEHVDLAVDLVSDILQHPTMEPEEVERERMVVLQELGQAQDTPDDIIFDHWQATAYPGQALGRPVLGEPEVLKTLDRSVLLEYLARSYGPANTVIAAAGKIEHEAFVELVLKHFDSLPRSASEPLSIPASYTGGDFREERDLEQIHMVLGFEGPSLLDDDFYALQVLSTLLGGGMSSRLFQEARENRGLVYSIFSFASCFEDDGLMGVYAGTGEREVEELISLVCRELGGLRKPVPEAELSRARAQIKAAVLMALESTSARCEQMAQQVLTYGRPLAMDEVIARIEAVDGAALKRVSERLLSSAPTFALIGRIDGVGGYDWLTRQL